MATPQKLKTKPKTSRRSEYEHLWDCNPGCMGGRKPKWTKEVLDDLADKMFDFVSSREDVLFVRRFFTAEGVRIKTIYDVMHKSEKFERLYELCKQICADRVHDGVLKKKLEGQYATRFMHFYDDELNKKDLKNEKKKLKQKLEVTKESEIAPDGIKIILEVEKA